MSWVVPHHFVSDHDLRLTEVRCAMAEFGLTRKHWVRSCSDLLSAVGTSRAESTGLIPTGGPLRSPTPLTIDTGLQTCDIGRYMDLKRLLAHLFENWRLRRELRRQCCQPKPRHLH
jgi:hypothetical protein